MRGSGGPLGLPFVVAPLLLAGCAAVRCTPAMVVVTDKERRTTLESEVRGLRVSETGRVVEDRRETIVRRYWIRDEAGTWYQVDAETWREAEPGARVEVCR